MRMISRLVKNLDCELEDAKKYANDYVEYKAEGEMDIANKFKKLANDEIDHAVFIHELAVSKIKKLREIYTAPQDMLEKWDKAHEKYVEEVAFIKMMLAM